MIPIEINAHNTQTLESPVTIGQMVVADYRKAVVFRKYNLDYCCGGKKSLEDACLKKGLDAQKIQRELDEIDELVPDAQTDFGQYPLDQLVSYIINKHHLYVAEALPMLFELTAKVARVHGEKHPELVQIAQIFDGVARELQMHMRKEEGILFPYITQLAAAYSKGLQAPVSLFGTVENPIRMMEAEHESAGGEMEEIRQLSRDYTPPLDACTSYRVLFAKLREFELDLHQHVHLENNILFPKAIAMEKKQFTV